MSDREARQLERSLRAEGRLEDVVWEILDRTTDPKLIALVVDKFSAKLSVLAGDLLTLRPEERPRVYPGETRVLPIMVPMFEGWRGRVFCFRVVLASNGAISWECRPRENPGGGLRARQWEGGTYTVPFASDPFELLQASVWELRISNEDSHTVDVDFSLICRHQHAPCSQCENWGVVGPDGKPTAGGPGSVSSPCPACRPEATGCMLTSRPFMLSERLAKL